VATTTTTTMMMMLMLMISMIRRMMTMTMVLMTLQVRGVANSSSMVLTADADGPPLSLDTLLDPHAFDEQKRYDDSQTEEARANPRQAGAFRS
jgi:hypothetical protein